jgi:DNA-binding NtrC family response regulator
MRVIIVTGFPKHPNIVAAEQLGFHQILTKPLDMASFIQVVKASLNGRSPE